MTTAASLATSPALPLLAQREIGFGVALCVVALALIGIAALLVRLARLDSRVDGPSAHVVAGVATFIALMLLMTGIPRVVAPRGMALGAQLYGSRHAGGGS